MKIVWRKKANWTRLAPPRSGAGRSVRTTSGGPLALESTVGGRCWFQVLVVGVASWLRALSFGGKKQFVRDANFVCNLVSRLISGWTVPRPLSIANGKSINSTTRIICKPDSSLFPRRVRLWYIYRYLLVLVILWVILTMWGCSRSGK